MDNILEKLSKNAEEHRFLKKTLRKMRIGIKRSEQTLCQCKSSRGKNQNGARTLRRCIEEISVSWVCLSKKDLSGGKGRGWKSINFTSTLAKLLNFKKLNSTHTHTQQPYPNQNGRTKADRLQRALNARSQVEKINIVNLRILKPVQWTFRWEGGRQRMCKGTK